MAFKLEHPKTATSPSVLIDGEKGYIRFEGESYLENVAEFFREVNDWLKSYLSGDFEQLTFDCAIRYCNSSTAKLLYNMLRTLEESSESGKTITVNWIVAENNIMMQES